MSHPSDDYKHGDVVMNPVTGRLFVGEWNRYAQRCEWTELAPIGRFSQPNPPQGATLLCRTVDGKRLPVTDLLGDLYAVETL